MKNFKILTEKENLLFKRREIKTSIEAEITPSRADAKKLISEKFSTQTENIKIKKISGKFGSKTFTITANIYNSKEDKDNIEPKSKKDLGAAEEKPEKQTTEQPVQPVETKKATEEPKEVQLDRSSASEQKSEEKDDSK